MTLAEFFWKMQNKRWYSILGLDAMPLSLKNLFLKQLNSIRCSEFFSFQGLDCFCSHLGKAGIEHATKLAHLFNVTSDRMFHLVEERSPTLTQTNEAIKIGRVGLTKFIKKKKIEAEQQERPYFLTRPAARLLEFIAMCIKMNEPALIVGETGVGKTSAIQFLAQSTGHELVAVNLNQQTESCDLIGGKYTHAHL